MAIALFASELGFPRRQRDAAFLCIPSSNPSTIISLNCIYGKFSNSNPMPMIRSRDLAGVEGTCGGDVFLACCAFVFGHPQASLSQDARFLPLLLRSKTPKLQGSLESGYTSGQLLICALAGVKIQAHSSAYLNDDNPNEYRYLCYLPTVAFNDAHWELQEKRPTPEFRYVVISKLPQNNALLDDCCIPGEIGNNMAAMKRRSPDEALSSSPQFYRLSSSSLSSSSSSLSSSSSSSSSLLSTARSESEAR